MNLLKARPDEWIHEMITLYNHELISNHDIANQKQRRKNFPHQDLTTVPRNRKPVCSQLAFFTHVINMRIGFYQIQWWSEHRPFGYRKTFR